MAVSAAKRIESFQSRNMYPVPVQANLNGVFENIKALLPNWTAEDYKVFVTNSVIPNVHGDWAPSFWAFVLEYMRASYEYRFGGLQNQAHYQRPEAPTAQDVVKVQEASQPKAEPQTSSVEGMEPFQALDIPSVGFYTVVMADGSHVTIRVQPHWEAANSLVYGYLAGSENTSDYINFAHSSPNGATRVWRKFLGQLPRQREALAVLLRATTEEQKEAGLAYAMASGRCARCGRTLTVPASIHRGLGPECAKK